MPETNEQEQFLSAVFGQEAGYLFVSTLNRDSQGPDKWHDRGFAYPAQIHDILSYVRTSDVQGFDVYIAAQLYKDPNHRQKKYVKTCPSAWSDLDTAAPWDVEPQPSVVLETSPGRYHGFWKTPRPMEPHQAEEISRQIAYAHHRAGADLGGWDLTQVLRIPGTRNRKYDGKPTVKLLKCDPTPIPWDLFKKLPSAPSRADKEQPGSIDNNEPPVALDGFDLEHWQKTEATDRSAWAMRMVATLKEHGLADRLVEIALANHPIYLAKAREKWGNRESVIFEDIRRCIKCWRDSPRPLRNNLERATAEIQPGTTGARLDVVRMSDVKPEPIEWLWEGRFARGKPTLIMGDPGLGKSLITHYSSAIVSVGGEWPDGERCERGSAILFSTEDGLADTIAPRLIAAGADMPRVLAVRGVLSDKDDLATRMFALTEHLALLEKLIIETGAIFLAMDPITAYLGPDINSHKESDVRAVLGPVSLLAERTRVVLVMLMHLNKGSGVSALYRAVGSIAFPAVARVVLGVAPDPNQENRRLLLPIKMNIGELPDGIGYRIERSPTTVLARVSEKRQPPVLIWDNDPVGVDVGSAMDRSGTAQELGAAADVKDVLVELLADGRVPAARCKAVIRESTGTTSETTLGRARRELGVKVRKEGFGEGGTWYWELPSKESRARARTQSLESLESSIALDDSGPKAIKAIKDSKDYKDSLSPAREGACIGCGGPLPHPHTTRCADCAAAWNNPTGQIPFDGQEPRF